LSKLLACVSSARATDMLAIPATATARTIADTFAFFMGGSLSVAAARHAHQTDLDQLLRDASERRVV
jgi:hypothetical protein